MSDYFDHPAMSQSKLKDLKKSPKHFWAKHIDPYAEPMIETDAMRFGSAVHACLFEHQKFITDYIVAPNVDKRTKECKAIYAEFVANSAGKTIISADDIKIVKKIRDSVLNKKTSRVLLNGGIAEHEIFWVDNETGISCKGKLDYFIEPCELYPNGVIIDPKTTLNAEQSEFAKTIYNFGYHNQMAFYCSGIKTIYKTEDYPCFIFLPVEKTAPYECGFFEGDRMMLELGLRENSRLLNLYKKCKEKNKWYGYEDKVQTIELPSWVVNKFNFEEF